MKILYAIQDSVRNTATTLSAAALLLGAVTVQGALAQPVPGGTVDPTTIPQYVTPLVIPPVMKDTGQSNDYEIAVRQFKQQILPPPFKPTTVWSYGPARDKPPQVAPVPAEKSQFNYPAFTIEARNGNDNMSGVQTKVRWINDLVDRRGRFLPHLLPVDQTVHWANPPEECADGPPRTDCVGIDPEHYQGPVPIITHVHGAHVGPESDGYPEAWYLPDARGIGGFASHGRLFDDATGTNPGNRGYVDFEYPNDQRSTTLWYHDHTLGMTRLNVYAGPAGFWLIRQNDGGEDGLASGTLPGPAPKAGEDPNFDAATRAAIREIPIVIQDRSFDMDGAHLFYPKQRAFFEGVQPRDLKIPFAPDSDVLPTWQPEAFFNVMVVNGVSWPKLDVVSHRYRFRLLNGCNSRFLNLRMEVTASTNGVPVGTEVPFYVIGTEGGLLPNVVQVRTGSTAVLPGNGTIPSPSPTAIAGQALLMGLAERMDVIVDFNGLAGTEITMYNTAPDEPFGGELSPPADAGTTGQVMKFIVSSASNGDPSTPPANLVLAARNNLSPTSSRKVSLNEAVSNVVCVLADEDTEEYLVPIKNVRCSSRPPAGTIVVPFGPTAALLGTVNGSGATATGNPLLWTDTSGASTSVDVTLNNGDMVTVNVTENPALGATETWEMYNFTADAHPIHLHLVQFQVAGRTTLGGGTSVVGGNGIQPFERGWKDTVISYPGEITRVNARFDLEGLFVWHCHIVEHEDNEMMRPYCVGDCSAPN